MDGGVIGYGRFGARINPGSRFRVGESARGGGGGVWRLGVGLGGYDGSPSDHSRLSAGIASERDDLPESRIGVICSPDKSVSV